MNQLVETEITQIQNQVFKIENNEDLVKVNAILKGVKGLQKKVKEELDPEIAKAHDAHKGLTTLREKYLKPLKDVEIKINDALKKWQLKIEQDARDLQDKINKDLSEKAEQEKQRLLSEATDEWSQEVAQEKASEIKPVTVDLKECQQAVTIKQEGQYKRSNWKAKCVDIEKIPLKFLMVNESALNYCAKDENIRKEGIPGVEFYDDFTIVTKA